MKIVSWLDVVLLRLVQLGGALSFFRERCRSYDVYLATLLIFAGSRVVVILGLNFGKLLVPVSNPEIWDAGQAWYDRLLRWDSGWYLAIARDGYRYSNSATVPSTTGFYPLYPLVSNLVKSLFGLDVSVALLLVANVAAVVAAFLLTKLVKDELGDEIALWSLAFFFFFPSSIFLSAGYAEPLCLLFILLSFILLAREKFVLSATMAGLSLATRSAGIVMIPVILWEIVQRSNVPRSQLLARMMLCGLLAASGLLVFMIYLWIQFGDPLAFATAQVVYWQGGQTFGQKLMSALTLAPFRHFKVAIGGWFVCMLALTIWGFRRLWFTVSLYALGALMLPYLTKNFIVSTDRYVLMCFPAFISLSVLSKGRRWLGGVLIGIFAAMLLRNSALFSQWYWIG
jgi:Gpi18-like mannosyltransferase